MKSRKRRINSPKLSDAEVEQKRAKYQRWYSTYRDTFNALRRKKYKNSPIYRLKCKMYAKTTSMRKRSRNRFGYFLPKYNRLFWYTPECRVYYTASVVVREIHGTYSAFRFLSQIGVIPSSVIKHSRGKGWSLYSAAQVLAVREATKRWNWDRKHLEEIKEFLLSRWHDEDEDWEGGFPERELAEKHFGGRRERLLKQRIDKSIRLSKNDTHLYTFEKTKR